MAKRTAARERTQHQDRRTEADLRREVVAMLTAAGWNTIPPSESRARFGGNVVVSREDLGSERRYAIQFVLRLDNQTVRDYFARFRNWLTQSKEPFSQFDEFWLIGYEYDADARLPVGQRHFQVFDLNELRALFASPRRARRSKARTKIGKAIEANEQEITLAVVGLILQIDANIEKLNGERPNSDEAIAERHARITEYKRMRNELQHIQTMVAAFKKGAEKEAKVVKSVKTFADGVGSWWDKHHAAILTKTFDMGLFTTAVSICSMAGAGGRMAVAVSAVLVGGKPAAQALKGLIPKRFMSD